MNTKRASYNYLENTNSGLLDNSTLIENNT